MYFRLCLLGFNMNTGDRVRMQFSMPLSEIILDFYDKLKQITSGYARYGYAFDNGNLYLRQLGVRGR